MKLELRQEQRERTIDVRLKVPGRLHLACKVAAMRKGEHYRDWMIQALRNYLIQLGIQDPVIAEIVKDWERR